MANNRKSLVNERAASQSDPPFLFTFSLYYFFILHVSQANNFIPLFILFAVSLAIFFAISTQSNFHFYVFLITFDFFPE